VTNQVANKFRFSGAERKGGQDSVRIGRDLQVSTALAPNEIGDAELVVLPRDLHVTTIITFANCIRSKI